MFKKYLKTVLITAFLLSATASIVTGCASSTYSKGFDEAD